MGSKESHMLSIWNKKCNSGWWAGKEGRAQRTAISKPTFRIQIYWCLTPTLWYTFRWLRLASWEISCYQSLVSWTLRMPGREYVDNNHTGSRPGGWDLQEILAEPFPECTRREWFQLLSHDEPNALSYPGLTMLPLPRQRGRKERREGKEGGRGRNITIKSKQGLTTVRNKGYFCIKWKYKRSVFRKC